MGEVRTEQNTPGNKAEALPALPPNLTFKTDHFPVDSSPALLQTLSHWPWSLTVADNAPCHASPGWATVPSSTLPTPPTSLSRTRRLSLGKQRWGFLLFHSLGRAGQGRQRQRPEPSQVQGQMRRWRRAGGCWSWVGALMQVSGWGPSEKSRSVLSQ